MRRFPILLVVAFVFGFPELSFGQIRWHGGSREAAKEQFSLRQSISCMTGLPDCLSYGWRRGPRRQPTKKERILRVIGATAAGAGLGYAGVGMAGEVYQSFSAARPRPTSPAGRRRVQSVGGYASDVYENSITMRQVDTVLPQPGSPSRDRRPTITIPREDVVEETSTESVTVKIGNSRLSNSKSFSIDVYDGNSYLGRLAPNEWWLVGEPQANYQGWTMKPTADGQLIPVYVPSRLTSTGWIF